MNRRLSTGVLVRGVVGLAALAVTAGCGGGDGSATATETMGTESNARVTGDDLSSLDGLTVQVRRDPGCGCCMSWVEYLQKHGASVEVSEDADRATFRMAQGIGDEAASCHTAMVDGYAIEGHVPVSAIQRLLEDRPDAAGLALPGMPAESPGMGGDPAGWERLPVMLVGNNGSLSPFEY